MYDSRSDKPSASRLAPMTKFIVASQRKTQRREGKALLRKGRWDDLATNGRLSSAGRL